MKVAVLGAGIAGLASARELQRAQVEVVVFEAAKQVGGRCCTFSLDGYTFDPAAITLTPRGKAIESVIFEDLDTEGLTKIERPIYAHDGKRTFPASAQELDQYCYAQGMQRLPELLAEGIDVRLGHSVESIESLSKEFDAVVVTSPTPEAIALVNGRTAHNTRYRPCITVALGFEKATDAPFCTVLADESAHPLNRLSIESSKVTGRAPEGHTALCALFGPKYSKWHIESSDEELVKDAMIDIGRVLGEGYESPVVTKTFRWQHGIVETNASFKSVNPNGSKIVIAGDGVMGGRIEYAYESGVNAAKLLTEQ